MATVSAKDIAELRARTGAGMMDCKKALEETGGNIDEAIAARLNRPEGEAGPEAAPDAGDAGDEGGDAE